MGMDLAAPFGNRSHWLDCGPQFHQLAFGFNSLKVLLSIATLSVQAVFSTAYRGKAAIVNDCI